MITFTVHAIPTPKGRPRVVRNRHTGRVTTFTPERTTSYEAAVGLAARAAGVKPMPGAVGVRLVFFVPDCRQVDIDNLEKAVLDGLNKIAWADDSQVCEVVKHKFLDAERPRAEVSLWPASPPDGHEYPVRERSKRAR